MVCESWPGDDACSFGVFDLCRCKPSAVNILTLVRDERISSSGKLAENQLEHIEIFEQISVH